MRNLILIFGDQLNYSSSVFDGFDKEKDMIRMAEVEEEITYLWTHKLKIAFFLSAMRHFRDYLVSKNLPLKYHALTDKPEKDHGKSFSDIISNDIKTLKPEKLVMVQPGDYRVLQQIQSLAKKGKITLEVREDTHFYYSIEDFKHHALNRKSFLLENFYRELRKKFNILMDKNKPEGGDWNYDQENRKTFGKRGPDKIKPPLSFSPDGITREVINMVESRFANHPGKTEHFDFPVTRQEALKLAQDFITNRLHNFGTYQDAMWQREPFLFHSRISAAMNIKLISPKELIDKIVEAYHKHGLPLNSVEGFIRQVLGWREFIRGIYWNEMPEYLDNNFFEANREVPAFYWHGKTKMACVGDAMQSVINYGYAHHIQRLMVLGLFAQLHGVHPARFHDWHMAMYNDAIDWVSLPNAFGMSQFGDGGIIATKPYTASANYINKMSNYCKACHYNHKKVTENDACPFNALYWDFLDRNQNKLADNRRMLFQMRNLEKKSAEQMKAIKERSKYIQENIESI